ncbi:HAAS signaling domain-containing protein [Microtetraspora malaysiensis]|uniref:HAAS signaling domain-containing protein n=1 Tax=Microtetraspora malaysiensis TaxID=161358 RepID=UPI003D90273D
MTPRMDPEEYARAVRVELDDLPAKDRDELLEDLDDHLTEVAAESDVPLEERLGSPAAYAAELRAAYGGRPARPRRSVTGRVGAVLGAAHRRLLGLPPYRQVVAFLPELRPAWWAIRGYALALVVLSAVGPGGVVPGDPVSWAFTLMVIWASVWLGRRTIAGVGSRWRRTPLILANAGAAWAVLVGVAAADHTGVYETAVGYDAGGPAQPVEVRNVGSFDGGGIYNIVPYAADGTALTDVRLYDQDGRPIILEPEMYNKRIDRPCVGEPPMANSYPLALRDVLEDQLDEYGRLPCDPATAQPSATPAGSTEPSPEPSGGSSPEPSTEPSPEPSGKPAKKTAEPSARPSDRH